MKFKIFFGAIFVCLILIADILFISHFKTIQSEFKFESELIKFKNNDDIAQQNHSAHHGKWKRRENKFIADYGDDIFSEYFGQDIEKAKKRKALDGKEAYKIIDFNKISKLNPNISKEKVIYEALWGNFISPFPRIVEFYKLDYIKGIYIDLNNDGVDEIVGTIIGHPECELLVLQKEKDESYKTIFSYPHSYYIQKIYISDKKAEGYRTFVFYSTDAHGTARRVQAHYYRKYRTF